MAAGDVAVSTISEAEPGSLEVWLARADASPLGQQRCFDRAPGTSAVTLRADIPLRCNI